MVEQEHPNSMAAQHRPSNSNNVASLLSLISNSAQEANLHRTEQARRSSSSSSFDGSISLPRRGISNVSSSALLSEMQHRRAQYNRQQQECPPTEHASMINNIRILTASVIAAALQCFYRLQSNLYSVTLSTILARG
jgi:hypothetical protein